MRRVTIPVVSGDDGPIIKIRIDDANTGNPIGDFVGDDVTAHLVLREQGETASLAEMALQKVGDGSTGEVLVDFHNPGGGSVLADLAGGTVVEGQLWIDFNGMRQTVQTLIRFTIHEAFAEPVDG